MPKLVNYNIITGIRGARSAQRVVSITAGKQTGHYVLNIKIKFRNLVWTRLCYAKACRSY